MALVIWLIQPLDPLIVICSVMGVCTEYSARLCRLWKLARIISAPAVNESIRVFARLSVISVVTRSCSAADSRMGDAEDPLVFGVREKYALISRD